MMPDLEKAVHASVAAVPAQRPDLAGVRARARTFRRRRTALGAAAAVLAVVAVVPMLRPGETTIVGDPAPQRPLGLWLTTDQTVVTDGLPSGAHVPGSMGEITAQLRTVDGTRAIVPVGPQPGLGAGTFLGPAPLPDGSLATVGVPPADRMTPSGYQVVVTDPEGRTVVSRPLPKTDTHASRPLPMTGSTTALYWWQFRGFEATRPVLLTYDIAAGTLRELTPRSAPGGYQLPYTGMQATADRIVQWPAEFDRPCSAETLDARTGERVALLRPALDDCAHLYMALSPDNKRVAVLGNSGTGQRVTVLDAGSGAIQNEFEVPPLAAGTDRARLVSGIDWVDERTVRYARGLLPKAGQADPAPVVMGYRVR
ncbi:MAG: hypothetical protein ABW022_09130 [Actinoplanes sp.]